MSTATPPLVVVCGYATADQPGLRLFRLDPQSGQLTAAGSYSGIVNPSFVIAHPNRRWLYAVSETGQADDGSRGAVWALRRAQEPTIDAPIEAINQQPSGGDFPCHLRLDATGRWLLVANYGSGSLGVLPVQADGSLGALADLRQHQGHGPHPQRQEGPHVHSSIFTPDNRYAIVADLGLDRLVIYALDAATGRLADHAVTQTRPGAGPRHSVFDPSGERLYVANELDNTVSVYRYDAAHGTLHEQQTLDTLPPAAPENTAADIHISPDGRRVFVSNRGHNSLAVFEVAADGRLRRSAIAPCGGDWPRNFALAPGGRLALVANQRSHDLTVLPLHDDGTIGGPIAQAAVAQPSCVQLLAAAPPDAGA